MKQILLVCVLLLVAGYLTAADFAISIDAEKDAFYTTLTGPADGWLWISSEAGNDNGIPDDDIDLSANFWCAWDADYFYFYEEVSDDIVLCNNATNYQNDCLELKFEPDFYMCDLTTSGIVATRLTALDSSDAEDLAGVDNFSIDGADMGWTAPDPSNYARKLTDTGYMLEGRLLWSEIARAGRGPVIPEVGNIFGMGVMNHDNDDAQREGSIEWASHVRDAVWIDPKMHGTVTFLADNKLQFSTMNEITGVDTNMVDYTPKNVKVADHTGQVPAQYMLSQNYPNPFNPSTTIEFSLPAQSIVSLKVYDVLGSEVADLVNEVMAAGNHTVNFNGADLSSGVYFYKLNNGDQVLTNKMMLVK
jgi:hypothetical protein